jgi:hypothetical protein
METSRPMLDRFSQKMNARSAALLVSLDNRLDRILVYWLLASGLIATARLTFTPHTVPIASVSTFASYMLLIVAPFASTLLALHWFRGGESQSQPRRFVGYGKWHQLTLNQARRHCLYGTSGIMVSLLVGMMLNVPMRVLEYFAAIPPLPAASPPWLSALHLGMTFDAVLFSSLYMIAFVAALRRAPLFPRLLLSIWIADLAMQLVIAKLVVSAGNVPVGVASALHDILNGNVKKVLISMALWLPYLLLSTRVNVTYRHRIPA